MTPLLPSLTSLVPWIADSDDYASRVANVRVLTRRLTQSALGRFGYSLKRLDDSSAESEWGLSDADRLIVRTACRYSMAGTRRMSALVSSVEYCIREGIEGDFVECGVWRGGSALAIALKLEQMGVADRNLWLYDTFQGMTAPTELDVEAATGTAADTLMNATELGDGNNVWAHASLEDVRKTLSLTTYPTQRVSYVVGDVTTTLTERAPEAICLLRLDTDFYDSTRAELEVLYSRVSSRGLVVIDDYGHWLGARAAVDEFIAAISERPLMVPLDYTGRLLIKP